MLFDVSLQTVSKTLISCITPQIKRGRAMLKHYIIHLLDRTVPDMHWI